MEGKDMVNHVRWPKIMSTASFPSTLSVHVPPCTLCLPSSLCTPSSALSWMKETRTTCNTTVSRCVQSISYPFFPLISPVNTPSPKFCVDAAHLLAHVLPKVVLCKSKSVFIPLPIISYGVKSWPFPFFPALPTIPYHVNANAIAAPITLQHHTPVLMMVCATTTAMRTPHTWLRLTDINTTLTSSQPQAVSNHDRFDYLPCSPKNPLSV